MRRKINRTGEINYNNFGSKMIITKYTTNKDIDVYFPEYDWTIKNTRYTVFKKCQIKCPYEPRLYGVGYLGEGNYKVHNENGKRTKCYNTWNDMLKRCYSKKYHKKYPTYKECTVCDEWLNYQNFAKWYDDNYYEIENERMHLDKDILHKGNKIYSPKNCIFVPEKINTLFVKSNKIRGKYPIGVAYCNQSNKFQAHCKFYDFKEGKKKQVNLGRYNTTYEAFESYKRFKEKHIKVIAEHYKGKIPDELYQSMCSYKVEITD